MAVTVEKALDIKNYTREWAFPVANGETIYKGTIACIDDDGYLRNLSSTYAPQAKLVCYVADGSANSAPAATTAAGSISGAREESSAVSGDKTVRVCYIDGYVRASLTSTTQANVGKTQYASDNFTIDEAMNSGVKIGTLVSYIDADEGWIALNQFYQHDGTVFFKQALNASSALFNIANPTGATILVEKVVLDITTGSTAANTINVGVGASAASADTLIDGVASSVAGIFDNGTDAGTNGGLDKAGSSEYITGTMSAAGNVSMVGTVGIWYRYWE